jgi:hypothetical protein
MCIYTKLKMNNVQSGFTAYYQGWPMWIGMRRADTIFSWHGMFLNGTIPASDSSWWDSNTPIDEEEACVYYSNSKLHEDDCDRATWFFCETERNPA